MIVREFYRTRQDGVNLFKTYSDKNLMIRKVDTDEIYDSAIDVEGVDFVYEETDQPIEVLDELLDEPTNELADNEIVETHNEQ